MTQTFQRRNNPNTHSRRAFLAGAAAFAGLSLRNNAAQAADLIETVPVRDPSLYRAYIPASCKAGQFHHYTCEFDAAWAVLRTFGIDTDLDMQLAAMEIDDRVEPYYEETAEGVLIHGGDIGRVYEHSF